MHSGYLMFHSFLLFFFNSRFIRKSCLHLVTNVTDDRVRKNTSACIICSCRAVTSFGWDSLSFRLVLFCICIFYHIMYLVVWSRVLMILLPLFFLSCAFCLFSGLRHLLRSHPRQGIDDLPLSKLVPHGERRRIPPPYLPL